MKKLNLLNILILVTTVLFSTAEAFGNTTAVQTLSVSAQDAVTIEKVSGGVESGNVDGETGKHGGLSTSFTLQVNDLNTENIFVIGSKIAVQGGEEVSAFSNDGSALLFGRYNEEEYFPTLEAINNAKEGGEDNANVIAYPISKMNITLPMTVEYNPAQETEEGTVGCYVINLNGGTSATLEQTIDGTPYGKTYSGGQDKSGTYRSVVFFSIAKP